MPEYLHPGVYVQERRTGLAPIQGVSTSTMGIVGFTPMGPSDEATLVTSYPDFVRTFGDFTADTQVPTHVYAFFANGGRRCYVVRVTGSGSVKSTGAIYSQYDEDVDQSDGTVGPYSGTFAHDEVYTTVAGGTVTLTYNIAGTPLVGQVTNQAPAPDGVALSFAGQLPSVPVPGTIVLTTTKNLVGPVTVLYDDSGAVAGAEGDGVLRDPGGVARGAIDYTTGKWTLTVLLADVPVATTTITADYTPVGAARVITDNGAGVLTGTGVAAGTITYTSGAWSVTFTLAGDAPYKFGMITAHYSSKVWDTQAISEGLWGDDVRVDVRGNENYYTRATATYSRYDLLVYMKDSSGAYQLEEMFEDLSFTDPTDARYVGSILNNVGIGSDLIDLIEPSNQDVGPRSLSGYSHTRGAGCGNGTQTEFGSTAATPAVPLPFRTAALQTPVAPGSVVITYKDTAGLTKTITDDGDGNLIGDIAAGVGFNVVNYDTGAFAFKTSVAVGTYAQAGAQSVPQVVYSTTEDDTVQQGALSGGSDGAALTRNELTDPALKATRKGMYALLPTNELINLTIPDAAGNVTMSNDQVTEAETNGLWFIILATPPGYTPTQAKNWRINTLGVTSSYAALYYPYIQITDPVSDLPANVPPGGHIAGVYARTDANKSVGKAPAGTDDGKLLFATGVERKLEFSEVDVLHPNQVNAIMDTPQTGLCVWGARTLERPPSDFRFVHVRRLFNFLKASIFNSTHGFVFENVGPALWGRIKMSIEGFLLVLYSQGMFAGTSPKEAFAVICDDTNNPPAVQDAGQVICDIYVAANTPGEFIVFRIQQKVRTA